MLRSINSYKECTVFIVGPLGFFEYRKMSFGILNNHAICKLNFNLWTLIVTLAFEVLTWVKRSTLKLMMLNIIVKRFLIPSKNSRVMLRTSKSGRTDGQTESAKSKCLLHKVGDIIIHSPAKSYTCITYKQWLTAKKTLSIIYKSFTLCLCINAVSTCQK